MSAGNKFEDGTSPTTDEAVDVQDIHEDILRETEEPRDGFEPVPMSWLLAALALMMWGGWYLGRYAQDFDANRYDGSPDKTVQVAVAAVAAPIDPRVVGKRIYNRCSACHQADGAGVAGAFPPLAGSEWVLGDADTLGRILLGGLQEPMQVLGKRYNGVMPAWPQLADADIAAVLTYIRSSWGNQAEAIPPERIASLRQDQGKRTAAWTVVDLAKAKAAAP